MSCSRNMARRGGGMIWIALAAASLAAGGCKKDDPAADGGPVATVLALLNGHVFAFAAGYAGAAQDEPQRLDGQRRKTLIYFKGDATGGKGLDYIKVVMSFAPDSFYAYSGKATSSGGTQVLLTDLRRCHSGKYPASSLRGASMADILTNIKPCEALGKASPADSGPADSGPDSAMVDSGAQVDAAQPMMAADSGPGDAAGASDAKARDQGMAKDGATAAKGLSVTFRSEGTGDQRLTLYDSSGLLTLTRVDHRLHASLDPAAKQLLGVYYQVERKASCIETSPKSYLYLMVTGAGKLRYSKVQDNYSTGSKYLVEEGTLGVSGQNLTFKTDFTGNCPSKFELLPTRAPVFPVNLRASSGHCSAGPTAKQEVLFSTTSKVSCGGKDHDELALTGQQNYAYVRQQGGAWIFPGTEGSDAHAIWSILPAL